MAKTITAKSGYDCVQAVTSEQKDMKFKTVSSMHIVSEIKKLRIGKAAGPDNIPITVVRDVGDLVAKPLAMIFNSSLENCIFPDSWKLARVTPIFKSGVKKDVNSYRPTSVISVSSRILESIVHDQILNFILDNNVLTKNQSAFRKLHSTITSLIGTTDYWYENIDNKKLNLTILLDLRKAFDTVDHEIMIKNIV